MSSDSFNPIVLNIGEKRKGVLNFTLTNSPVSIANAIRRAIITYTKTVCLKTEFKDQNENCIIEKNTSLLNNEIIKQRLQCIPVHITNLSKDLDTLQLEIDVRNNSEEVIFITTENFKLKDKVSGKYLEESEVKKIFPPHPFTKMYIDLVRLRPKLAHNLDGEILKLSCNLGWAMPKESGCYNSVCTCSYGGTLDFELANEQWSLKEQSLLDDRIDESEIENIKENWFLLEAKRFVVEGSFDFIVESIGVWKNHQIMYMACENIIEKLEQSKNMNTISIEISNTTLPNTFDMLFEDGDYTFGKAIEEELYNTYFLPFDSENKIILYVTFYKEHPHDKESILRISFKNETSKETLTTYFQSICESLISKFSLIKSSFDL
jgi:DNA-directed RNA polymerase subunit L